MALFQFGQSVTTKDLQEKLNGDIQLVDVRSPEEYRGGHIKQAKNVPLYRITSYKGNKQDPVYVICQSGIRSKQAAKELKELGYQVINVRGGMNQWLGQRVGGK
ncbi:MULTISPECIES: rhodanese-like domain-containing protein [Enterococcus]|uniref:Rhodanese domain-containing protein n=1 Tax=Candidatus Enterococcus mangumiae TaxID=2230878 RepID=A0ABZ2SWP9_9ENTE|nr:MULTISPECIES: rhodanese-like domain-containing protein [unclassified Enterococcus]MBO0489771.1 rhodanese-like domain-containing protein [Enterococcus sp. DIV1094]MBO1299812.1 rhodanese-like domain-containing protein [Enterococcus sp. DIV1271a]